MGNRALLLGTAAFLSVAISSAWAYTPFKQSLTSKKNDYIKDGVFTGGHAGQGTSILGVRRSFSAKAELERIIVDLGDKEAHPAGRGMGYFQASLDAGNKRVVLDISQLSFSKVTEAQVQRLFKNDPYVASVDFTMDPQDRAATMVLHLKRPMKLEVFQLLKDKMPARIVLDLTPNDKPMRRM